MVDGIDESKTSTERLIKVKKFSDVNCTNMYYYLVPFLEKPKSIDFCVLKPMMLPIMKE